MNPILTKYRQHFKPINDIAVTDGMLRILVEVPPEQQETMWFRDADAGSVCVFMHDNFPGKIIEYVQGSADDSVTTLYESDSLIADRARLKAARGELITEIGAVLMRLPSTVGVRDEGRERTLPLRECSTAQLMDLLAQATGTDIGSL